MGRGQGGINMDYNLMADSFDVYKEKDVTSWVLGYRNVIKYLVPLSNERILDYPKLCTKPQHSDIKLP